MIDNTNLDFEPYINLYQGHTRIDRALFIAESCSVLEIEAYLSAINDIMKETHDVDRYSACVKKLNAALTRRNEATVEPDNEWIKTTKARNKQVLDELENELKTYKNSMVKESIRVAQTKLGDYYYDIGELTQATRYYSQSRSYCVTSKNMIDMCFNMIKTQLESRQYPNVYTYIVRAESTPQIPDKANTMSKLKCYTALSSLFITDTNTNRYSNICNALTQGVALESSSLLNDIMSPNDVAIYGGLCALASLNRRQLQDLLLNNTSFKGYLELEPQIREIMDLFQASKYSSCFALLDNYRNDWKLDLFLSSHIDNIIKCIREKAIIQYCIPYSSIDMNRMAFAFNTTVEELEYDLVNLISQSGKITARIDSHEKILYANQKNQRKQAFDHSLALGKDYEKSAKALMLRLNLLKADMVVR